MTGPSPRLWRTTARTPCRASSWNIASSRPSPRRACCLRPPADEDLRPGGRGGRDRRGGAARGPGRGAGRRSGHAVEDRPRPVRAGRGGLAGPRPLRLRQPGLPARTRLRRAQGPQRPDPAPADPHRQDHRHRGLQAAAAGVGDLSGQGLGVPRPGFRPPGPRPAGPRHEPGDQFPIRPLPEPAARPHRLREGRRARRAGARPGLHRG